jgi:hypothetical protein
MRFDPEELGVQAPPAMSFLSGGGQMGAIMRAHDWSRSPLGSPAHWPQSLRSVVGLLLNSQFPMFVAWGSDLGFLYNDAYAQVLDGKHPQALGARFFDIWSEIWPDISPLIDAAMAGEASFRENLPLLMNRRGYDEQTWFTFSYSPVRDESGRVAGLFCACSETTDTVLTQRRVEDEHERMIDMFRQAPGFMAMLSGPDHVRFQFHPTQELEDLDDGSVIVRFKASGHLEMCWHLYEWGDSVEVLAPPALAQLVHEHRRSDFPSLP